MQATQSWKADVDPARDRWLKLAVFALWLGLVVVMEARHTFFRDEVRALSLALQGRDIAAMLAGVHGEGHPAVWYLLLRGAHLLWPHPTVLPIVGVSVAAAAALLCVLRGPFAWWMILLGLLCRFALFEYSVMARNYGVSVLVMFVIAAVYGRARKAGLWLGVLLALLANTNIHSVVLAGAFLVMWLFDTLRQEGLRWSPQLRTFAVNAAVAALGVIACAATVYPTFNDAAVIAHPGGLQARDVIGALVLPGAALDNLFWIDPSHAPAFLGGVAARVLLQVGQSLVLFGAALSLVRYPGAFLAALGSLLGLSLLSVVISHGAYRHDALWLCLVISLHWIVRSGEARPEWRWPAAVAGAVPPVARTAGAVFVALLATQAEAGVLAAREALSAPPPGRPDSFTQFIKRRADLSGAVIMADPDFLLEAMPYGLGNPTYLVRESRFGAVVHFTRRARLALSLPDLLQAARRLQTQTHRPVIILLATPLDHAQAPRVVQEGYDWTLTLAPAEVAAFQGAVLPLGHFVSPSFDGDYDAYLLKRSD